MPGILVVTCSYPRICREVSWGQKIQTSSHRTPLSFMVRWVQEEPPNNKNRTETLNREQWGAEVEEKLVVHFPNCLLTVTCWFSQKRNSSGQNTTVQISNCHSPASSTLQGYPLASLCSLLCVSAPAHAQQTAPPHCGHGSRIYHENLHLHKTSRQDINLLLQITTTGYF